MAKRTVDAAASRGARRPAADSKKLKTHKVQKPHKAQTTQKTHKPPKQEAVQEELLVDPEKPWYLVKIREAWEVTGPRPGGAVELAALTARAAAVYAEQVELYNQQREMSKSDRDWLKTVMTSGTTADKCSSFQMQIAEAPLYSAAYLGQLLGMAQSTSRHEAGLATAALQQVFQKVLPPVGVRKMLYIKQRHFAAVEAVGPRTLLVLHYEEAVKRAFFEYLKLVEVQLQDQIAHSREAAMRVVCQLGCAKDEQVANVAGLLVSSLRDPDRKLASRAMYYLQEVVNQQPEAMETIVGQVEQLLQRPGVREKTQYYGLTFLSQLMLTHDRPAVTERLVRIYLATLRTAVLPSIEREAEAAKAAKKQWRQRGKKRPAQATVDTELAPGTARMAKVVAIGLNRALPYYKGPLDLLGELAGPVQSLVRSGSFATALQALSLYFQIAAGERVAGLGPEFCATLEAVLGKAEVLTETSAHPQLLALLYRVLVSPALPAALTEAVLKAAMRLTLKIGSVAFSLSSLLLLAEILERKPAARAMLTLAADAAERPADLRAATQACLWEVQVLAQHYDARVARAAQALLSSEPAGDLLHGQSPFEACAPAAFLAAVL